MMVVESQLCAWKGKATNSLFEAPPIRIGSPDGNGCFYRSLDRHLGSARRLPMPCLTIRTSLLDVYRGESKLEFSGKVTAQPWHTGLSVCLGSAPWRRTSPTPLHSEQGGSLLVAMSGASDGSRMAGIVVLDEP